MVNAHGRCTSATFICALCTRPRIFAVPTPRAMPAKRLSKRRISLCLTCEQSTKDERTNVPALLRAFRTHDRLLCATVYKCLNRRAVHLDGHIKHDDPSKALWRVLERMLHILEHSLLPDRFLDAALCFDIVRICVKARGLEILLLMGLRLTLRRLSQELGKTRRVVSRCGCEIGMHL